MTDSPCMVLVVGLQKSGTTLMNRLLATTGAFRSLGKGEADEFWGNKPSFTPTADPAGSIYQQSGGDQGHETNVEDADDTVSRLLRSRLPENVDYPILNKNPYNTVRLPWLRALFPKAVIVAMVRNPAANVFSITKKFVPHSGRGTSPEEGWWGVKPRGWREMVCESKVKQAAIQWRAVNERLIETIRSDDLVFEYSAVCTDPLGAVSTILARAQVPFDLNSLSTVGKITCRDHEFQTGATLRSKNRLFRNTGTLATPALETQEHPSLTPCELELVDGICGPLLRRFSDVITPLGKGAIL